MRHVLAMMIKISEISLVIGLLLVLNVVAAVSSEMCGTYPHRLSNGETLQCQLCPPGQYRQAHCTRAQQTQCVLCGHNTFSSVCSRATKCALCKETCEKPYGEVIIEQCTLRNDLICGCAEGTFRLPKDENFGVCQNLSHCDPGYGAVVGNRTKDTECTPCPHGTYSNLTENYDQKCIDWTECDFGDEFMGNATHDVVCAQSNVTSTTELPKETDVTWVAGLVIGVILLVAAVIAGVLIWKWWRRRQSHDICNGRPQEHVPLNSGGGDAARLPLVGNEDENDFDACAQYLSRHIIGDQHQPFLGPRGLGLTQGAVENLWLDYRQLDKTEEYIFQGIKTFEQESPARATPQYLIQTARQIVGNDENKMKLIHHLALAYNMAAQNGHAANNMAAQNGHAANNMAAQNGHAAVNMVAQNGNC